MAFWCVSIGALCISAWLSKSESLEDVGWVGSMISGTRSIATVLLGACSLTHMAFYFQLQNACSSLMYELNGCYPQMGTI